MRLWQDFPNSIKMVRITNLRELNNKIVYTSLLTWSSSIKELVFVFLV